MKSVGYTAIISFKACRVSKSVGSVGACNNVTVWSLPPMHGMLHQTDVQVHLVLFTRATSYNALIFAHTERIQKVIVTR